MILKMTLIFLCIIALCCIIVFIYKIKNITKEDNTLKEKNLLLKEKNLQIQKENEFLHSINDSLNIQNNKLHIEAQDLTDKKAALMKEYSNITASLTEIRNEINHQRLDAEHTAQTSFSTYCDMLDNLYKEKEKEYDDLIFKLEQFYTQEQDRMAQEATNKIADLQLEIAGEKEKLNNIRATRQAIIAVQLKEEEIKKQKDFYCLSIAATDKQDIQILEDVKHRLTNSRILSMLIWSTYFQKKMTTLCNNILGTSTITGIYKITNQENNKCYIGQSVDIAKRWKDHAKCGLGIDTPAGNKLYQDMKDFGIWNFSWELLEECSREQLNDKERYYIDLYQSKDYGYNTTKGNK